MLKMSYIKDYLESLLRPYQAPGRRTAAMANLIRSPAKNGVIPKEIALAAVT